jgi:lysophospholipase L1-like esterase
MKPDQGRSIVLQPDDEIVAIGDSITEAGGYLRAMEAVFAQHYAHLRIGQIGNAGIGGQKAEELVARFDTDVLARMPSVVLMNVGINDVWHRLDAPHDPAVLQSYEANVEQMISAAHQAGVRVYLLSPTVIEETASSEGNRRLAMYVTAGQAVARRQGCAYIDLHRLFLEAIEAYRQRNGLDRSTTCSYFTTDGVHMQPPGDALMAVGVLRGLDVPDEVVAATDLTGVWV